MKLMYVFTIQFDFGTRGYHTLETRWLTAEDLNRLIPMITPSDRAFITSISRGQQVQVPERP